MKRKVLFVLYSYNVGGTAVSTRNLVSLLDESKYEPYIWVLNDKGVLKDLYKDCNLVKTCFVARALMLTSYKEEKGLRRLGALLIRFAKNHSGCIKKALCNHAIRKCIVPNSYDTIIACKEGKETDFVSYINHPNLVAWVRCDYASTFSKKQIEQNLGLYRKFKHVVCVSEKTMEGFIGVYPEFANKTICIYNPQNENLLVQNALIDDYDKRFKTDKTCIVSVGRIHSVKRFSFIPSIASALVKKGLDFYWYIIGDGHSQADLEEINKEIQKNNMEGKVVLLGAKANAHYYINKADLLVTLSKSEACPRVVNEAKILHTPVVSTDFPTIYEYIVDHENGLISPIEKITDTIYEILTDNELYNKIEENISAFSFDNTELMQKIYSIL